MAALTADRNTPERSGNILALAVAATAKIYGGAIVALNSDGYAVKGSATAGLLVQGMAYEQADNSSGADGDLTIRVKRGVPFRFNNSSGSDAITEANVGQACYVVDDNTVALTDSGGARPRAGIIHDVDSNGVWVKLGATPTLSAVGNLNFPSIAAAASADLTIALPGAKVGDAVVLGLPAAPAAGLTFMAFVSDVDTVTVRAMNITGSGVDAAAANYRVTIVRN